MKIFPFVFNPFQVNTYIILSDSGEALVIDPGMYDSQEFAAFDIFIQEQSLKLIAVINTHAHIDHILGNEYVRKTYNIPLWAHRSSNQFLEMASEQAMVYGLMLDKPGMPDRFLSDEEEIKLGNSSFFILYTPGHADGSICLHFPQEKILISGDVLFNGSIGRTDLPTGNMELLLKSISEKLMVLPEDTRVFPGHGPETSIAFEQRSNPFLR